MDFPLSQPSIPPLFFGTLTYPYSAIAELKSTGNATVATGTWPTANLACYVPVMLPYPYPVKRVWWANGSSAGGNNDFGIYTMDGARIYSTGPTAGSGNDQAQFVTPTEFLLAPGRYYFALSVDNTTANRVTGTSTFSVNALRGVGVFQQGSAGTLPATATFAAATGAYVPWCGVTQTSSGF